MQNRILPTVLLVLAAQFHAQPLAAQTSLRATPVASGLVNPTAICAPAGDFSRLFLVEQAAGNDGRVRILDLTQQPPLLQPTPYLTVSPIMANGEQGLLGLAFHPDFANNGYFFVYYTDSNGDNHVARYQGNAPYLSSDSADPASQVEVLTIIHPYASNHNGGWIGFGPDGLLYITVGDGGPSLTAQDLGLPLGKVLRIDVDGDDFPADSARNYAIPFGNPFVGTTGALPELWLVGLRNPWRASFDRATGDLWIGDVGNAAFEEVEFIPGGVGGGNLGWDCVEGFNCTGVGSCACPDPALTAPVHVYPHTSGNCCIIGGARYRGQAMCDFEGLYFFGDWCSGRVWTLEWTGSGVQNLTERTVELASGGGPPISLITSFGEDAAGELYLCDTQGDVYRIEPGTIVDCNGNGNHDACDLARGTSSDWNGDGVPDECQPTGTPGCFGDGTTATACPCANTGALGRGCDNSAATGGARLEGVGDPALDTVVLASSGERRSAPTIFLQGDASTPAGIVFGDGVRCTTGTLKRLYVVAASAGVAHAPAAGQASITARSTSLGDPLAPLSGLVRYYQAYYRDPDPAFCPGPAGNGYNISSMLSISW